MFRTLRYWSYVLHLRKYGLADEILPSRQKFFENVFRQESYGESFGVESGRSSPLGSIALKHHLLSPINFFLRSATKYAKEKQKNVDVFSFSVFVFSFFVFSFSFSFQSKTLKVKINYASRKFYSRPNINGRKWRKKKKFWMVWTAKFEKTSGNIGARPFNL